MIKNIVIVGGGTAGWMTALYAQRSIPNAKISLIESDKIGILGAGEGSTPVLISFLDSVGISVTDLITNCKTTVKNSVRFTNWSGDGDHFHHSFNSEMLYSLDSVDYGFFHSRAFSVYAIWAAKHNKNLDHVYLSAILAEQNKVPLTRVEDVTNLDPIFNFQNSAFYSLHFDASLLARYFRSIAEARGVKRVEGVIDKVNVNSSGRIESVKVDNELVDGDFFFDCSGFTRLLIGKTYQAKWNSYSTYLPNNRALPFFTEVDRENIKPYTDSIAMKYGWMWRIPLQHRVGNGYVFDSSFISDEEAKEEIEDFLGYEVDIPTVFSFDPGSYETSWIKNCCAIGLSAGFIEPLEAMSIAVIIASLDSVLGDPLDFLNFTDKKIEKYNSYVNKLNQELQDFLCLHYLTKRSDTEYWRSRSSKSVPDSLDDVLVRLSHGVLSRQDFSDRYLFNYWNYLIVVLGKRVFLSEYEKTYKYFSESNLNFVDSMSKNIEQIRFAIDAYSRKAVGHSEFLEELGGFNF